MGKKYKKKTGAKPRHGGVGDAAREASEGWAKTKAGWQARLKAAAWPQTTQAQAAMADRPNADLDDFFRRRDGPRRTSKKPFVASFVAEAPASRGRGSSGGSITAAVAGDADIPRSLAQLMKRLAAQEE